jgi:dipeptidyl aminopeptidase/acylaminoacyl peptidase
MKPLDLQTLLHIPCVDEVGGVDISPDGQRAAFSWNRSGQLEIYEVFVDGSQPARLLTQGVDCPRGAKVLPRYSPDGRYLAYLEDNAGSEAYDIWLIELATGQYANLTPDTAELIQPDIAWSPDGREIAFIRFSEGRFSTFVLSVELGEQAGQSARLVSTTGGPHFNVGWSPDGELLVITAQGSGQDYDVFLVSARGNGSETILKLDGAPLNGRGVHWSKDGRHLALATDAWGDLRIAIYAIDSASLSPLPFTAPATGSQTGTWEEILPGWSTDGEHLAYVVSQGANTWLRVVGIHDGGCRSYQVESGVHYAPHFTPDGQYLVFIFESPRQPGGVWRLNLSSGEVKDLTHSLPAEISPEELVMPEEVWYPSQDGALVPALLYLPPRVADVLPPALVVIHGGPNWLFQFFWYPVMIYFASQGWVVLAPNYRGSTGYGRAWQMANRFEMGRLDVMDVAAGADYLVRRGLADAERITVTGRSHGGYLTMCCLTNYPHLWAGGSAVVPFLNWFTSHKNSRQDLQHWDRENMGDPITHANLWRERSPFFSLERIQAPVQLICGANDQRCPASESIQARDVLKSLGKTVDLVLYPDEGHVFLKRENVVDHETRRAEFLLNAQLV